MTLLPEKTRPIIKIQCQLINVVFSIAGSYFKDPFLVNFKQNLNFKQKITSAIYLLYTKISVNPG